VNGPVKLYVGVGPNNQDWEAQSVLEYTARKFCSLPLEITWMMLSHDKGSPFRGWNSASWTTPFTGLRWGIPAACQFDGRAIYTDVDFFFRADLAELWAQDIPGVFLLKHATGKLKTCCMLLDCAKAKAHFLPLDELRALPDANGTMLNYFRARTELLAPFQGDWNCVDGGHYTLDDQRIKAIHYSRIETQLHLTHAIPRLQASGQAHWYQGEVFPHARPELQALFDELLEEAIAAGYQPERYRVEPYGDFKKKDFRYKVHPTKGAR
jgi:hypothetical protein